MFIFGSGPLIRVRELAQPEESPRRSKNAVQPKVAATHEQLAAVLNTTRPLLVTAIGSDGLAPVLWLMLFKPF